VSFIRRLIIGLYVAYVHANHDTTTVQLVRLKQRSDWQVSGKFLAQVFLHQKTCASYTFTLRKFLVQESGYVLWKNSLSSRSSNQRRSFTTKDVKLEFFHNRSSNRYKRLKTGHRFHLCCRLREGGWNRHILLRSPPLRSVACRGSQVAIEFGLGRRIRGDAGRYKLQ